MVSWDLVERGRDKLGDNIDCAVLGVEGKREDESTSVSVSGRVEEEGCCATVSRGETLASGGTDVADKGNAEDVGRSTV